MFCCRRFLFGHIHSLISLALLFFLYGPIFRKVKGHTSLPPVINIGAIFEVGDEQMKNTLLSAVDRINGNGLLPRSRLNISSHFVEPRDAFNGAKVACGLLESRVWAIISSRSESISWLVGSLAAELAVPHISVSWSHRESPTRSSTATFYSRFPSGSSSTTTRSAGLDYPYHHSPLHPPNQPIQPATTSSLLEHGDFAASPSYPPPLSPSSSTSSLSSLPPSSAPQQMQSDQPISRLLQNTQISPNVQHPSFISQPVKPANPTTSAESLHRDSPASRNLNWLRRKYGGNSGSGPSRVVLNGKPHLSTTFLGDPSLPDHLLQQQHQQQQRSHQYPLPNTVNFYPDSGQLSNAFHDFVYSQNWKSFILIYDDFEGLVRMKDLLRISAEADRPQLKVSVIRFPVGSPGTGSGPPVTVDNSQISLNVDENAPGMMGSPNMGGNRKMGGYYHPSQLPPQQIIPHHRSQNYPYSKTPPFQQQQQQSPRTHRPTRSTTNIVNSINLPNIFSTPNITAFDPSLDQTDPNSTIFYFEREQSYVYKKLLKNIKKSEHNFVLYLTPERAYNFLKEAYQLQRMTEYDNFLIATMDIHLMDLSAFANTSANITGFSMLNSMPADLEKLTDFQRSFFFGEDISPSNINHFGANQPGAVEDKVISPIGQQKLNGSETQLKRTRGPLSTTEALLYDAVTALSSALNDLDRRLLPEEIVEPAVSCSALDVRWPFGEVIVRQLKSGRRSPMHGLSGPIAFDSRGHRVNFALDILQLKGEELKTVGKWTPKGGIESMANHTFYDNYKAILVAMKNKELRITVPRHVPPYIYLKDNADQLSGNDKFDGFCVELLQKIATVFREDFGSDFKYTIQVVGDEQYGRPNKETGEWNGMMGELMRHQADLAIADLTATYQRETAVDFTMPFMNLGITILFKKVENEDPELFSFLKPFSVEVWLYLASSFLGISILFWLLSRIAPDEWESPHPCEPDPLELENQFSIGNSLWFAIGSLMQQGSDLAPKAVSTRILAGFWWFFTLIIISSYTANLAASLTLSRMAPAISNVEDLAKQTQIQYGCKKGGSTYEFFASSNHSTYQRMYNTMESNQEVYINDMDSAIERVRKGGYAYLAESSTIEYLIERKCDLYEVGSWLDNKGYGIATPTESPYRTPISNAIVVLQDRGELYELKKNWWEKRGGNQCKKTPSSSSSQELKIENVGGVFVVLGAGVAIGCLFGALEFIWKSLKVARDERDSIGKLIWLEIVRICTGGGSSRPVFNNQSSSNTTMANSSPNGGGGDQLVNTTTPNGTLVSRGGSGHHLPKVASFTSSANGTLKMGGDRNSGNSGHPSPHFGHSRAIATNSPALANYNYDTPTLPPPPRPFQHHQPQQQQQNPTYGSSYDSSMPLLSPSLSGKVVKNRKNSPNEKKRIQQQHNFPSNVPKSPSSYSTMY